jgi:hypothetical protein
MPQDIRTYSEIELSQGTIKGDALGTLGAFGTGTDAFGAGTEHGSGKGTNIGTGYRAVRGAGIGPTDREEKEKQMKGLTESEYSGLPQKELSTQIDQPFHLPTGKPGTPKLDLVFILPAETKRMYNFDAYIRNFINTYLSRLDKKCSCALGLVEYRTFDTRGHKIRGVTTDPHIFSDWLAEGAQAFREYGLYDGPADAMLLALERITFRKKAKIRFVLFIEASIYNIPILAHQREGSYVTGWYTLDEVVKQLKAANVAVDVAFFNDCKVASFIANTTGGRVWSWISR